MAYLHDSLKCGHKFSAQIGQDQAALVGVAAAEMDQNVGRTQRTPLDNASVAGAGMVPYDAGFTDTQQRPARRGPAMPVGRRPRKNIDRGATGRFAQRKRGKSM